MKQSQHDKMILQKVVRYMVKAIRTNPTQTQINNLNSIMAQRHHITYSHDRLPIPTYHNEVQS